MSPKRKEADRRKMPIFEYICECGYRFERLLTKPEKQPCPQCGCMAKSRIATSSFRFKEGYPRWVDGLDTYQKRIADRGEEPDLPGFGQLKEKVI